MRQTPSLDKRAIRAALQIHEHLAGPASLAQAMTLPTQRWDRARSLHARLEQVTRRGWPAAAKSVLLDLQYELQQLRREIEDCQVSLPRSGTPVWRAPPAEIVADITMLAEDFDGLKIDLDQKTIEIVTKSIVLDDVRLGRFRVVLHWPKIGRDVAYDVVALEPCPPQHDTEVTHPHVRDACLCEGDGAAMIRGALTEGRLYDFFVAVRQILETYNPSSPFVRLEEWDGVACRSCGYLMPGHDAGSCERCGRAACAECCTSCERCDTYLCDDCSSACDSCDTILCGRCLGTSDGSGRRLCSSCHQNSLEEDSYDETCELKDDSPGPGGAGTAPCPTPVHASCLDEAPVSA